uniref:SH2 domain-containing protein n=1 Tax=Taenia asiatica TaxID=60517 RepID=A0A0R3VUW1_TAEAS
LQSQQRPPPPSQSQSRKVETKVAAADLLQTSAESGKPGLLSHISPLHAPQTSSPSAYQPNFVPISVSPHSPQFFADSNTPPNRQHHPQFHQPPPLPPPPPLLGPPEVASQQPSRGYACQSAWGLPGTQDCGSEPVGNALNNSSTATSMIGDMSLVEYRRTYSDSCIPSSFPDAPDHSRCFPPHQQYHRQQNQPLPPPPQLFPPPLQQQRQQPRQQQRTLPPVDELTFPRCQNTNSNTTSNSSHASCFNGSPLSSRCRHQSSTTVSQQPFRRLQSDYHSMRNIPQRYAPVHHHHHNPQQTATPVQPLVMQPPAGGEGYASGSIPLPYQTWNLNGSGEGGGSVSACDLPSSSSALRLKRFDVYSEYRPKPPPLQLLPQASQPHVLRWNDGYDIEPKIALIRRPINGLGVKVNAFAKGWLMSTAMGYENHSARSGASSSSSDGGGYFDASAADPLAYHQLQSSCAPSMLSSAAATTASNNGGGSMAISSSTPLTQPLDISVLDSDAFRINQLST